MTSGVRMVHLRTVSTGFHARVIAARLGAEGIRTEMRGGVGGTYPFGDVSVWVAEDDAALASELLLADEVEAVFVPAADDEEPLPSRRRLLFGLTSRQLIATCGLLLMLMATMTARLIS